MQGAQCAPGSLAMMLAVQTGTDSHGRRCLRAAPADATLHAEMPYRQRSVVPHDNMCIMSAHADRLTGVFDRSGTNSLNPSMSAFGRYVPTCAVSLANAADGAAPLLAITPSVAAAILSMAVRRGSSCTVACAASVWLDAITV